MRLAGHGGGLTVNYILIGAGGHAKAIAEAITVGGGAIEAYVDPRPAPWLDAPQIADEEAAGRAAPGSAGIMGFGAVDPDGLTRRLALLDRYLAAGRPFHPWIHPLAHVSESARLGEGCLILTGATVHPAADIGKGAIVNTGAIVEHDSRIGAGAHIAPGAIVLGGCTVGDCSMIGAGAVVLPGAEVKDRTTVAAASRYPLQ